MRPTGRQFRVFVSSTFSDFKHEREALQERVFPKLRAYCESQGARFQAIDLRWGISEDAAHNHQTVRICLEEIRRSQRLSPRPNFMVLLGDRYGWRPIPDEIPAEELEHLRRHFTRGDEALINTWYARDDNAVPPVYYLRPRPAGMDDRGWEKIQARLAALLRRAVTATGLPESELLKYFASATHLEVSEGLLNVPDAGQHVFAYCRGIEGLPEDAAVTEAADFVDIYDGVRELEAIAAQSTLKALIRARLPDHTRDYRSRWLNGDIGRDHIDTFCADVEADLKAVIDQELAQLEVLDPLEWEAEQHKTFGAERARIFIGRDAELARIAAYLASDSTAPLVVHGPGGMGKSALLASAIEAIDTDGTVVVQRFIGTTPESTQLRALLTSLCRELGRRYEANETVQYDKLDELFALFASRLALANTAQRLVLVLDSLDQLDVADMAHQLQWLPLSLPPAVKVIASTRQCRAGDKALPVYHAAERRYRQNFLLLGPLQHNEGDQAFDALLGKERTITPSQRAAVLEAFAVTGTPLYLKLIANQARRWRSDTRPPELPTEIPTLIRALIAHLKAPANHGPVFVERALAYLQAGRYGGLTDDELAQALTLDPDVMTEFRTRALQPWHRPELPPVLWSRLHADLAPYLTEQTVDGATLYRFFHREFAEVVEADGLAGDDGKARHTMLAKVFAWHSDPAMFRRAKESRVLRQMMEQPYQLHHSDRIDDLKVLLTDFNFALSKCAANRSDDLIGDYLNIAALETPQDSNFRTWIQFMSSRAHILRRGTLEWPTYKILQQLAVEHADDSPVTQVVEAWLETGECDWLWFRGVQRPQRLEKDFCLSVMEGHTDSVNGTQLLSDGHILSWSQRYDHTLRLWSADGVPLTVMEGHTAGVRGVQVMADRGHMLSWSRDCTLRLWSPEGVPLAVMEGHTEWVNGTQLLNDGRILSWSDDNTLRLWSVDGAPLNIMMGHTDDINGTQELGNGRILSWSDDNTLRLWSPEGEPLAVMKGHIGQVNGAQELGDGRILSWSDDNTLRLWSPEGEPLAVMEGHAAGVRGAQVLGDERILSWSWDSTLRLWSPEGEPLAVMEGHTGIPTFVQVLGDGRILSCMLCVWRKFHRWDNTLRLWSPEGEPLAVMEGHTDGVRGVQVMADGHILSWSEDNTLRLWSPEGVPLAIMEGHRDHVNGAQVLGDGRILSWSDDNTLRLWSPEGVLLAIMEGHTGHVNDAQVLGDGRILSWSDDNTLRLWLSPDEIRIANGEGHTGHVNDAQVLGDGRILSWSDDNTLRLWSPEGAPIEIMIGHEKSVFGAQVLGDGRILSWSADGTLRLWSSKGAPLTVISGHIGPIRHAHVLGNGRILSWSFKTLRLWSPEGAPLTVISGHTLGHFDGVQVLGDGRILSWSDDNTLRLWSVDGAPLNIMMGHTDDINGTQELGNGRILSWSDDNTLRLWSPEGEPLAVMKGHIGQVNGAQELGDGRILSWSDDNTLRLWSPEGEPLAVMEGHAAGVRGAQVLGDERILSWSWDSTLRLWSPEGEPLAVMEGHTAGVRGVQVLGDERILSWSEDRTLRLWQLSGTQAISPHEGIWREVSICVAMSYEFYTKYIGVTQTEQNFGIWVFTHRVPILLRLYSGNQQNGIVARKGRNR